MQVVLDLKQSSRVLKDDPKSRERNSRAPRQYTNCCGRVCLLSYTVGSFVKDPQIPQALRQVETTFCNDPDSQVEPRGIQGILLFLLEYTKLGLHPLHLQTYILYVSPSCLGYVAWVSRRCVIHQNNNSKSIFVTITFFPSSSWLLYARGPCRRWD